MDKDDDTDKLTFAHTWSNCNASVTSSYNYNLIHMYGQVWCSVQSTCTRTTRDATWILCRRERVMSL